MNRREALTAIVVLPAAAAGELRISAVDGLGVLPVAARPACPEWADDWNDVARHLANWEETANRQQLPLTEPTLEYASAMQFGTETFLIFGMRGWDEYRRHVASGTLDVLGHGVSRHGAGWGVFCCGVLSEGLRAEFRRENVGRERRQAMTEAAARHSSGRQ